MSTSQGLLTEYEMLQSEINSNSQVTATVFTVTVTACAGLIGFGVEARNWLIFLAPFAVLLPSLWFVASQLESTMRIATYVRTFIEPEVEGLEWEGRLAAIRATAKRPESKYTVSITGIYGAIGGACLGMAWLFVKPEPRDLIALGILSVTLLGLTGYFVRECRRCFGSDCSCAYLERWEQVRKNEANKTKRKSA